LRGYANQGEGAFGAIKPEASFGMKRTIYQVWKPDADQPDLDAMHNIGEVRAITQTYVEEAWLGKSGESIGPSYNGDTWYPANAGKGGFNNGGEHIMPDNYNEDVISTKPKNAPNPGLIEVLDDTRDTRG
jgi:hypothetical protein